MFIQAGIKDFTLIGGGVELKYYPYLSTVKDITDGLLAYYPNALPSIKPESLPSKYFILSSDYSMYGNNILASLNCIDFSKGAGVPKTLLLTFSSKPQLPAAVPDNPNIPDIYPLSSVPQGIAAEEEVYISKIQDYKAYLVYQAGGLSITVEARIIKKLDDTTYLVENVNSGKMLMAKTLK